MAEFSIDYVRINMRECACMRLLVCVRMRVCRAGVQGLGAGICVGVCARDYHIDNADIDRQEEKSNCIISVIRLITKLSVSIECSDCLKQETG